MTNGADDRFLSPYQFIPVTRRIGKNDADAGATGEARPAYQRVAEGRSHIRHDRWQSRTGADEPLFSGRLLCRVITATPTLVGAGQKPGESDTEPDTIENYRVREQLAIPGSSLRGMTAAVAEAISGSALRVLDDRDLSVRKTMYEGLKAIGLLRRGDAGWRLLPLAWTGLPRKRKRSRAGDDLPRWSNPWQKVFPEPLGPQECEALYFGDYWREDGRSPDWIDCFQEQSNPTFVYSVEAATPAVVTDPDRLRIADPTLERPASSSRALRGVVYVLGWRDRGNLMPKKRREWFVPYAEDWEERLARLRPGGEAMLPVPDCVIETFETIAAARADGDAREENEWFRQPYLPKGYQGREPASEQRKDGFLRDGDLVYFDVDETGAKVTEIAYSAIWRRRVRGTLHQAFERAGGKDSLPWSPDREHLTPAECLFGVVEDIPRELRKDQRRPKARNLASRVRFSDALPAGAPRLFYEDGPRPLRQLQSPKPPSPSMYFRTAAGGAVRKDKLNLRTHLPNGRKRYLVHNHDKAKGECPWESRKLDGEGSRSSEERAKVRRDYVRQGGRLGNPLDSGQEFWFHVDFDNLSQSELDLLCAALDPKRLADIPDRPRPDAQRFEHRIGWGKPVGLGAVRVDLLGLFLLNRDRRYGRKGLFHDRYQAVWTHAEVRNARASTHALLARCYAPEITAKRSIKSEEFGFGSELIDWQALAALVQLGNPDRISLPVTYPISRNQDPYDETDGYEWFANNDDRDNPRYQFLKQPEIGALDPDEPPTEPPTEPLHPNSQRQKRR